MTFYIGHKRTRPKAKLTPVQVLEIVELTSEIPFWAIAEMYGTSYSNVNFIYNGYRWQSLTGRVPVSKPHVKKRQGLKLTRTTAQKIRTMYKKGISQNKLARQFKVSQPVVFDIVKGRTFK